MSSPEASQRRVGPLIAWLVFVGILVLLGYAARLSGTETPDNLAYKWSSSLAALIQYWLFLVVIVAIALVAKLELRETFALRRPASWPRALGLTVLCLVVIYLGSFAYERLLSLFGDWSTTDEQGLVPDGWDSSRAAPFVAFFLVVTLVAPAVEELTYRGLGISLLAAVGRMARDPGDGRALRSRTRSRLRLSRSSPSSGSSSAGSGCGRTASTRVSRSTRRSTPSRSSPP